jgi:hypothetical protein
VHYKGEEAMSKFYRINKSYGRWSSSTMVEGPDDLPKDLKELVSVYHAPTKQTFNIFPGYLTKARKRG